MDITTAINFWLDAKAISQAELARRCQVSRATVAGWVSGKKRPKGTRLPEVAGAFGCSLSEFFGQNSVVEAA